MREVGRPPVGFFNVVTVVDFVFSQPVSPMWLTSPVARRMRFGKWQTIRSLLGFWIWLRANSHSQLPCVSPGKTGHLMTIKHEMRRNIMTSSNGTVLCVTGEFTGHRWIHRSPVNSPHKGQWHGALMFSLICAWLNLWVNNREAGDLRRNRAHYDVTVMNFSRSHPPFWMTSSYP